VLLYCRLAGLFSQGCTYLNYQYVMSCLHKVSCLENSGRDVHSITRHDCHKVVFDDIAVCCTNNNNAAYLTLPSAACVVVYSGSLRLSECSWAIQQSHMCTTNRDRSCLRPRRFSALVQCWTLTLPYTLFPASQPSPLRRRKVTDDLVGLRMVRICW